MKGYIALSLVVLTAICVLSIGSLPISPELFPDKVLINSDSLMRQKQILNHTAHFVDQDGIQGNRYTTIKIDSFESEYVTPRSIEIMVPVDMDDNERFPVLYMFDGQNLFHSFTGWGGELNAGWRVDEVIDSLNDAGTIPEMIVVGIFNSPSRGAEYMPDKPADLIKERVATADHAWYKHYKEDPPRASEQLKFIVEELKPFIDSEFKTQQDRSGTLIAGSSMGGLISAFAICEYPEVFGGAACFSTHWPPLDGVFLEYFKHHIPDPSTHKIYFDYGTEGLDSLYGPYQMVADSAMKAKGYLHDVNWITAKYEGATHYENDWHKRFHIPMEFLLLWSED